MSTNRFQTGARLAACALAALLGHGTALAATSGANLTPLLSFGTATDPSFYRVRGELLLADDGNFYTTASSGGSSGVGAILRLTPTGTVTVVHSLAGAPNGGSSPYAGLIQASDGALYGTTYLGGSANLGTVYRVTTDGTYTLLHSFSNQSQGGFLPYAGVVEAGDGNLWGTTLRGGPSDSGTIFRISLSGSFSAVHSFNKTDGHAPEGRLAAGPDGALYGTTLSGGTADRGTVFRVTTDGTVTSLYSFPALGAFVDGYATNDVGANPRAGLTLGADGNFYGTTYQGGTKGHGTVFRITPDGTLTVLHHFAGPPHDGSGPLGTATPLADGSIVGTTERGGTSNYGVTWRIDPQGNYEVLHPFTGAIADGAQGYATLTELNGYLYGVSYTDTSVLSSGSFFRLELPANGSLPVRLSISPESIPFGSSATVTWDAPGATKCTTAGSTGAWTAGEEVAASGTRAVTPASAGIFSYQLSCVDADDVTRIAFASLIATTPAQEPVDGGGDGGGGALSLPALFGLAGALGLALRRRRLVC